MSTFIFVTKGVAVSWINLPYLEVFCLRGRCFFVTQAYTERIV